MEVRASGLHPAQLPGDQWALLNAHCDLGKVEKHFPVLHGKALNKVIIMVPISPDIESDREHRSRKLNWRPKGRRKARRHSYHFKMKYFGFLIPLRFLLTPVPHGLGKVGKSILVI